MGKKKYSIFTHHRELTKLIESSLLTKFCCLELIQLTEMLCYLGTGNVLLKYLETFDQSHSKIFLFKPC